MSKRPSVGGTPKGNTLFNYFNKSPATSAKKIPKTEESPRESSKKIPKTEESPRESSKKSSKTEDSPQKSSKKIPKPEESSQNGTKIKTEEDSTETKPIKRQLEVDFSDSDQEEIVVQKKKRSKVSRIVSDDEEDDNHNDSSHKNGHKTIEPKEEMDVDDEKPTVLMEKLKNLQDEPSRKTKKDQVKLDEIVNTGSTLDEPVVWLHNKLEFLKPDKIKDKKGRRPDHPDYNPGTLFVPESFLNSQTPGMRQWWVLKQDNYDCVLFFKVGKFYEFYHMDADVTINELGFSYMRGEFAHSGAPEGTYDKMATTLIERGYKVARIEQTETPDMMTERCKKQGKTTKFDKVVKREICQISNRGTQIYGSHYCQITPNYQPNYMLSVVEKNEGPTSKYGICFTDTSIGDFYMGEFEDDKSCSRFLTLVSHHFPVLIVSEKQTLSSRTQQIYRTVLSGVLKEYLPSGSQSWTAEKTLKHLGETLYTKSGKDWPILIKSMQDEGDHLGLTPNEYYKLALKALGGCINYLKRCHLEEKIMPMARYHLYVPPDMINKSIENAKAPKSNAKQSQMKNHMVLDSITLSNLRITGEEHSLCSTLDQCCTKFGKRLLHNWVCSPSCNIEIIRERQNAISDLMSTDEVLKEARALLATLPDFERYLAQMHMFGNKLVAEKHPDGRAIFFDEKIYNKKKIQNFINILKGFEAVQQIPEMFKNCESSLIKRLSQMEPDGCFPDLKKVLKFFKKAFDHEEALKTGVIAPEKNVDAEFDNIESRIDEINKKLQEYLVKQEKYFGCRLSYFGSDKKRFQLEVPESHARKAGKDYFLEGQKKGTKPCRRFHTDETKSFLKQMQQAEDDRNNVLRDLSRRVFEKFSNHYDLWKQCLDNVSTLDVLCSLAEYARCQNFICVPELVEDADTPFIEIDEGYHPCVASESYIPNGIVLGASGNAPLSLLTGPNMGGKSTLMRQIGLLVVMAQIGCHVPAQSCKLSLVDRIFTRLGAQDDILSGHSTFLVELNETSLILKHATVNSLVLLDELGRGTATYDGTAIAASVVNFLANLKCRTLFSTHYHNLIDFFHQDDRVVLGHMACMVENEDTEDPTQETVVFLYKYTSGACPKSYGFNAAKLAGMSHSIIKRAFELSKKVEAIALRRKIASKVMAGADTSSIKNLIVQLNTCKVH
ncbi:probable DNA mismatch repair protein Msh6 [Eupeodes corollae]|uniref:probable DNA mismatch repair protein Msh6 n=1 Tax=Eupeodes corollae TaxID=290404 RepID=UPI002491951B|nr:probable DNA mismatch repair protein Msh6 [Eupeodes corollae]